MFENSRSAGHGKLGKLAASQHHRSPMKTRVWAKLAAFLAVLLPSAPTRALFRLVGHKVGRNTKLPLFSFVCANRLELGNDVDIRPFVYISVSELTIGSNTIVSFGCQIKGEKGFSAGDNCIIGAHAIVHCDENVRLGFYSGVGPRCTIYTHGSFLPVTMGYPALFAEVVLEDFVWTAMGVLFLPGTHVEQNCIINPGVVVSGRVPAGTRLQMSPEAVKHIDQGKLLRFSRRSPAYYHQAMVRGFLTAEGVAWEESENGAVFKFEHGGEFLSFPATNALELRKGNQRIASYDLEGFYATQSKAAMHRKFLAYIRRRFGLTLRTTYRL
jgi:acetyltransferase-like isoleucine patch superfamily enzyme